MWRNVALRTAAYVRARETFNPVGISRSRALSSGRSGEDDRTPAQTKVAFASNEYGKDPSAGRTEPRAGDVAAAQEAAGLGKRKSESFVPTSKSHSTQSMFDSALSQQAEDGKRAEDIKREVASKTPDVTRVAFHASVYGKGSEGAVALSEHQQRATEALKAKAAKRRSSSDPSPLHGERNMFDSDLTQGSGNTQEFSSIKRDVVADTPSATRLAFGGSDYGKDPNTTVVSAKKQAEIDFLAKEVGVHATTGSTFAPVHHERAMFDSDLTQGAGSVQDSKTIKRDVKPDTPELTRLSFFGSTYGDTSDDKNASTAETLASKQTKGAKLTTVGRGARGSKVHDTKLAMSDDEYSQREAE